VRGRETDGCKRVDRTLEAMGLGTLKTPVRAPQANAFCERVIGTIRRERLDFIIPMSEWHVRPILLGEIVAKRSRFTPLLESTRVENHSSARSG
jgi:putative transposase